MSKEAIDGWKWRATIEARSGAQPTWMAGGEPACAFDECRHYDGKRCRLMGFRPGDYCAPAVTAMSKMLDAHELGEDGG